MNISTKLKVKFFLSISLSLILLIVVNPSHSAVFTYDKRFSWDFNHDLNNALSLLAVKKFIATRYMMIDIGAYEVDSSLKYAMVWRENTEKRKWAEHRDLTSSQYNDYWKRYKGMFRPIDFESYFHNGKQLYAGIWVENTEAVSWDSRWDMTASEYSKYLAEQRAAGLRLVDIEIYKTPSGLRYAGIWNQNRSDTSWTQAYDMSPSVYQKKANEYKAEGFSAIDIEMYRVDEEDRYAVIWEKHPKLNSMVKTNLTKKQFSKYRSGSYRLIDFERNGSKYGGVWLENISLEKRQERDSRLTMNRECVEKVKE